jgi:hypothetical protein
MYQPFVLGLAAAMEIHDRRILYLLLALAMIGEIGLWLRNINSSGAHWSRFCKISLSARRTIAFWCVMIIASLTLFNLVHFRVLNVPPSHYDLKSAPTVLPIR